MHRQTLFYLHISWNALLLLLCGFMPPDRANSQNYHYQNVILNDLIVLGLHDFDADGDLDMLGVDATGSYLIPLWLENEGNFVYEKVHGPYYTDEGLVSCSIRTIQVQDVDQDGDLDMLALSSASTPSLLVYENDGTGRLYFHKMPGTCWSYVFADVENTGQPELFISNGMNIQKVAYTSGSFSFETKLAVVSSTGDRLTNLQCGDLNQDGQNDLVFVLDDYLPANDVQDVVLGVYSTSSETWQSTVLFNSTFNSVGHSIQWMVLADGDGDGDLDIFTNVLNTQRMRINNGQGVFPNGCVINSNFNPSFLLPVELGNDGLIDFFEIFEWTNPYSTGLYRNVNCSFFGTAEFGYLPFVCDVNNDGHVDVFLSDLTLTTSPHTINVLLGDGWGGFEPSSIVLSVNIVDWPQLNYSYSAPDLDLNGSTDYVVAYHGLTYQCMVSPDGFITELIQLDNNFFNILNYHVFADMNGDGYPDMIHGASDMSPNYPKDLYIRWNNNGILSSNPILLYDNTTSFGVHLKALNAGDMDGDGDIDILFFNAGQGVRMLRNNGNGTFSSPITITSSFGGNQSIALSILDLDSDGLMDFSVFGRHYRNMGNTTFSLMFTMSNHCTTCAYEDLNNDGFPDLLSFKDTDSALEVFINNQNTGMNLVQTFPNAEYFWSIQLNDFDGDGIREFWTDRAVYRWNGEELETMIQPNFRIGIRGQLADGTWYANQGYSTGIFIRNFEDVVMCSQVNPTITETNNVLSASLSGGAYQWLNCDTNMPIPGAVGAEFSPPTEGNYALSYTIGGCEVSSPCILVTFLVGDVNNDNSVNTSDLLAIISNFGCLGEECTGDIDGDGIVTVQDILFFLTLNVD